MTLKLAKVLTRRSAAILPVFVSLSMSAVAQEDCRIEQGRLIDDCAYDHAETVVSMPAGPNTEFIKEPISDDAFSITIDGIEQDPDGRLIKPSGLIADKRRYQDLNLARSALAVKFDGVVAEPRLDVSLDKTSASPRFSSAMNYPAFVTGGELRFYQLTTRGRELISTAPLEPNETAAINVPELEDVFFSYLVFDRHGRFDETRLTPVDTTNDGYAGAIPGTGADLAAVRRIPVSGGSVTVTGRMLAPGERVNTLNETTVADVAGSFVMQRILPFGDHRITAETANGRYLERDLDIPETDFFSIGFVDVTLGRSLSDDLRDASGAPYDAGYQRGRAAFYLNGRYKGDYRVTAALDTREEDLGDMFRNLDKKDPKSFIDRINPNEYYPVYGDDSRAEITAPTSGRVYVRVERDSSHVMWGNFKSELQGTDYLRNERTLYGAQAVYRSSAQTSEGEPRLEVQLAGAQPETLPHRDAFLGTGGSRYFLEQQDISRGSETVTIEIRDGISGRVVDRKTLIGGVDYEINYLQGLVTLTTPLSGKAAGSGLVVAAGTSAPEAYLTVSYEYTPNVGATDAYSYDGRVQGWIGDHLRLGLSGLNENTGAGRHKAQSIDLLVRRSERSYLEAEYARSDGPGIVTSQSFDAGLTVNGTSAASGTGDAFRVRFAADLADFAPESTGRINGYYETREQGFSTLSHSSQHDEELWGLSGEWDVTSRVQARLSFDSFSEAGGRWSEEGNLEVAYRANEAVTVEAGLAHVDKATPGNAAQTGSRLDAIVKATYASEPDYELYAYGQATLSRGGGLSDNHRVGVGGTQRLSKNWSLGAEVSHGSTGAGGRVIATYERDENNSAYFGYELDPNRDLQGVDLVGRDYGGVVVGARRQINKSLNFYAENTYDLFGKHRSLNSTYGVEYAVNQHLSFSGNLEVGQVDDPIAARDFDRTAVSIGSRFQDEDLTITGRLEYRLDTGSTAGVAQDGDFFGLDLTASYQIDDAARFLASIEAVTSTNSAATVANAEYAEITLGYARRPVDNDRLNVLAKYNFVHDMTERSGITAPTGSNFVNSPKQQAHIVSLDASYDVTQNWTIGGKIGARFSRQDSGQGFVSNNAALGVLNARYHVVHNWDALAEVRLLDAQDVGSDLGVVASVNRHIGNNFKFGIGYNFGRFSDDLADVTYDDQGAFINLLGKF